MMPLLWSLAALLGGGALALAAGRRSRLATLAGAGGAVAGSLLGLTAAVRGLLASAPSVFVRAWSVPGGSFSLTIDGLSAFFLVPNLSPFAALRPVRLRLHEGLRLFPADGAALVFLQSAGGEHGPGGGGRQRGALPGRLGGDVPLLVSAGGLRA